MTAVPASTARKLLRDCLLLLLLAALPALLTGWFHPKRPTWSLNKPGMQEVELTEVMRWSEPVLWVDARTAEAFQIKHVPSAILLNENEWEQQLPVFLEAWKPAMRVVVYCDSAACDASQAVAMRLQRELNLTDIHVLKGGWTTWLKNHP